MTAEQVDDLTYIVVGGGGGQWAKIYWVSIWLPVATVIILQQTKGTHVFDHIKHKKAPMRACTVHVSKISRLIACTSDATRAF